MAVPQLLLEGLSLMAFGMGFVFAFLTLLVLGTTLMSRLVAHFVPVPANKGNAQQLPSSVSENGELMAAVAAAVHRYRRNRH